MGVPADGAVVQLDHPPMAQQKIEARNQVALCFMARHFFYDSRSFGTRVRGGSSSTATPSEAPICAIRRLISMQARDV